MSFAKNGLTVCVTGGADGRDSLILLDESWQNALRILGRSPVRCTLCWAWFAKVTISFSPTQLTNQIIVVIRIFLHYDDFTILWISNYFKLFNTPMKPAHKKQSKRHAMSNNQRVFRVIWFLKISM